MLYIFHGPDDFTRNQKLAELKEAIGASDMADLNTMVLDGRDVNLSQIRQHADAMPFLAARRLVIVHAYLSVIRNRAEDMQALIDYVKQLAPTTDLVFVEAESLEKQHPLLKVAAGMGASVSSFAEPEQRELVPWIVKRAKEAGGVIEPGAAEMLARLVGPNLRLLHNEIEKLALYVNGQRPVRAADVELLVPYREEAEKFGLSNAIGQRNARQAYDQLWKELDEGQHPMAILGSIAAQIRALLEVKDMAERGLSPAEIATAKGWRSDYAAKMRLREAANFSMRRLEQILEMLLDTDQAIKSGRLEPALALDMFIARLCQPEPTP